MGMSADCKGGVTGAGRQGSTACRFLQLFCGIFQVSLEALVRRDVVTPAAWTLPCLWAFLRKRQSTAVRVGEAEGRARGTQKPTCFGCHFQEVAIQVDVELRRLAGQRDARAVPAHGQVLLEADGAGAQHQVHRLGPGEGAGPARVVLHQHLKGRGRGGAVFCQNILTRPLKVKCPSVKSVVVGISEYRANAGLCGWVRDKSRS